MWNLFGLSIRHEKIGKIKLKKETDEKTGNIKFAGIYKNFKNKPAEIPTKCRSSHDWLI